MEQERAAVAVESDAAESQQQAANNSQKYGCAGIVKKIDGLCSWSNLVLVVIVITVATLMSFTVIIFYLPRNDKLNVVSELFLVINSCTQLYDCIYI